MNKMKRAFFGYKDLAFIVPALKADVEAKKARLSALGSIEDAEDERADLVNDLGFLTVLIERLEEELKNFY